MTTVRTMPRGVQGVGMGDEQERRDAPPKHFAAWVDGVIKGSKR